MQIRTADGKYETRSYLGNPAQQWGATAPLANGQLGLTSAGALVSTETALQLAAVFGSTGVITDAIATLPIRQWRMQKSGEPRAIELSPIVDKPYVPWPQFTMRDFITQGTMSYLLAGNVFGKVIEFDDDFRPAQVELKHPDQTRVRRNLETGAIEVFYDNASTPCPADRVTRSMGRSYAGGVVGLSAISYMRQVFGNAIAQDRMSGAFYANNAQPHGVIEFPGDVDPNDLRATKAGWLEDHQGYAHAYLPGFLTGGATYKPISLSMQDQQFLEQMQFSASIISGMIFRVPPHMLGMTEKSTSWGTGIEQQEIGFVRNTLLIWLARWEDWLTSWLAPGQFVTFDLSERLRGDTLQRWQAWQMARVIGAMNNRQIREAEGLSIPTDPAQLAFLEDYSAPLNSSPKTSGPLGPTGGDEAD